MPYCSPPDPRDTAGRAIGQAAGEAMRHYARAAMLLFKLATVPFWAPFFIASGLKSGGASGYLSLNDSAIRRLETL